MTWLRTMSFAVRSRHRNGDNRGRHNGNETRDQPAQPWPDSDVRKPSITIWPARVPVSVEFCPDCEKREANAVLAPAP